MLDEIKLWLAKRAIIKFLRGITKAAGGTGKEIKMPKGGIKTTEFWLGVLGNVLAFLGPHLFSGWSPELQAQTTAFLAGAVNVGFAGYAIARALVKSRAK